MSVRATRRSCRRALLFVVASLSFWLSSTQPVRGLEIGPDTDLCGAIEALRPGEQLVLQPGDYRAGCVIRRGGLPGAPLVIRAADPERRPRLLHSGRTVNMLEIRASDILIRGLEFGPTLTDADGVRIIVGNRIVVEDCTFTRMGGIAVVANHTSVRGLTVRRNVIVDSNATAMYFGCHDGAGCMMTDLLVEGNYIRRVTAPNPQIGYGVEVKLNSAAIIRSNVVLDTKGPGIMVYGSRDLITRSLIERNFVRGSRTSSGIVVGGGPSLVRNNVSGWNFEAGIGLENYGRRGLLRGIVIVHNSVYQNGQGGITVPDSGPTEATILNNAANGHAGTPALPASRAGLRMAGNVDCTWVPCFANPEALNFSPFSGSVLMGYSMVKSGEGVPNEDLFGVRRGMPPTVGAIERPHSAIRLDQWP